MADEQTPQEGPPQISPLPPELLARLGLGPAWTHIQPGGFRWEQLRGDGLPTIYILILYTPIGTIGFALAGEEMKAFVEKARAQISPIVIAGANEIHRINNGSKN